MSWLARWFRWLIRPNTFDITSQSASVKVWTTYQIPYTITPSDAKNKKVIWTSSDESIATVSSSWVVSPVTVGSVVITWRTEDLSLTDNISIDTYVIHTTWVSLNKSSATIYEWETVQLIATVAPADTSFPQVTWSTSNSNVATVSSNWLVHFVWVWSCTITVTTVDWWHTATCSITCDDAQPVSVTFSYTWADQNYTIPYTQCYKLEAYWWWSYDAKGWYASWVMCMTKWTVLKIMVWAKWNNGGTRYWFGWSSNYSNSYDWAWLSWVFTGSSAITATDSARALVIWWGAGSCSGRWNWWAGWWECGASWGTSWYWTQGWWWTQSGRQSWWNVGASQFCWWNGSWKYWAWGWGWWYWGNGTAWDSSAWDDKWAGWWSWYVKSTMASRVLTQWWGSAAQTHWCVKITSI